MQGFARLWERISQGFARDFGRGFARIHETLIREDSFARLWREDWERVCKDSQDFVQRIRERIYKVFSEDFGMRLWVRICETLGEDMQGFVRLWERIHKDL